MSQRFQQDVADATKKVDLELAGLTTATTRTITMPDGDVRLIPNGASLPTSAATVGELFHLDGVGLHKALDLVGNWLEYTGGSVSALSGTAPDWTIANPGATRIIDANDMTLQETSQAVCLLANDLIARGVLQ